MEVSIGGGRLVGAGLKASAGDRVRRLEETVTEVLRLLAHPRELGDPNPPVRPPLMIGGNGDRTLRMSARHADVVSFSAAALKSGATRGTLHLLGAEEVAERVRYFESVAGDRAQQVERNILAQTVAVTDEPRRAAASLRRRMPQLTVDQVADIPTVLLGTHAQIAALLQERRERFGFSYICVQESAMRDFAPVVGLLSGR